jgi:serine/threonine protein kinase
MAPAPSPPKQIAHYRILESLPAEGKVRTYRGIEEDSQRNVILRTVTKDLNDIESMSELARLKKQWDVSSGLKHPGIVEALAFGEESGTAYLALEFVEGCTLQSPLRVPIADAASMIVQVLRAMDFAHRQGVLHLNLSPARLVLTSKGEMKLTGFGGPERGGLESPYRSPEQMSGARMDTRSDLFSAGALFYEWLTCTRAFPGPVEELTEQICRRPEVPVSHVRQTVPAVFDGVCSKALAKSAEERYASAREFCDRICAAYAEALGGTPKDLVSNETAVSAFLSSLRSGTKKARTKQTFMKPEPKQPSAAPISNFDPDVLHKVEKELAPFLGPLARIVVKEAGSRATDLQSLYEFAAENLSNTDRAIFLRKASGEAPLMPASATVSDNVATATYLDRPPRESRQEDAPPLPKESPQVEVKLTPVSKFAAETPKQASPPDIKPAVPEKPRIQAASNSNIDRPDALPPPPDRHPPQSDIVARLEDLLGKQPENLAGYLAEEPPQLDQVIHAFIASVDALVRLYDANGMTFGLSPQSIVFDRIGNASIKAAPATAAGRTMLGTPMGSARYAAPELLADAGAQPGSAVAADVYALGMMFYEILLGTKLFRAALPNKTDLDWLRWQADAGKKAPTLKSQLLDHPAALSDLLESMMDKDASKRAKDPAIILMRLKSIAQQASRTLVSPRPAKVPSSPVAERKGSGSAQRTGPSPLTIGLIIITILLLVAAGVIALRIKHLRFWAPPDPSGAVITWADASARQV